MKQPQRGFTLIEIAIVLVIIGLLVGGVLQGEMITNARVKRIINDYEGVAAAIFGYQDRYRALPGDDNNADARFGLPGTVAANDGNGNGLIDGNWAATTGTDESRRLWLHLRGAKLVPGATTGGAAGAGGNQPTNPYGGLIGVDGANLGLTGVVVCQSGIPGRVAQMIDIQMDDGEPDTGNVRAALGINVDRTTPDSGIYVPANEQAAMTVCRVL